MLLLMMMMMIAPNSLVRQKEGDQGEEKQEAGGRRKVRPTSDKNSVARASAPIGPILSYLSDAMNRRIHGWWCVSNYRKGRGRLGSVQSSHDRNGGRYRKKNEVVKWYFCRD